MTEHWPWFARLVFWVALVALVVFCAHYRTEAKKKRILVLLLRCGEQTGRKLRSAGVGDLTYNYLRDLMEERLIERREVRGEQRGPEDFPLYAYRIRDHLVQSLDEDRQQRQRELA